MHSGAYVILDGDNLLLEIRALVKKHSAFKLVDIGTQVVLATVTDRLAGWCS